MNTNKRCDYISDKTLQHIGERQHHERLKIHFSVR